MPLSCLVVTFAFAILIAASLSNTAFSKAAIWFALFVVGQALYLQLIDAGPRIHYEHLRPASGMASGLDLWLLLGLITQSLVVFIAMRSRARGIIKWVRSKLGVKRAAIITIVYLGLGAYPSREFDVFAAELAMTGIFRLVQLGCLVMAVTSVPDDTLKRIGTRLSAFIDGSKHKARRVDLLVYVCAAWILSVTIVLAIFSYERHPHVPDEVGYLFHARYFAEGKLSVPAPPLLEAFETYLYDCNKERCISPVPPGWPAVLALGTILGVPWLVNPVLAALGVLLSFLVVKLLYDRGTARLTVLLMAASPWYLFMGMNLMTHMLSLIYALVAVYAVLRLRREQHVVWAIIAGIAIGLVSLTRPLEGLIVAVVIGLATLLIRGRRFRFGPVVILGLGAGLVGAAVFPYNYALTGNALVFPIMDYADRVLGPGVNALGFGPEKGIYWGGLDPFPGHGLPDVIVNSYLNLNAIQVELFGWSIGSLLPAIIFLSLGSLAKMDFWLLIWIGAVAGFHSLYWFSGGPDFAARYWFLVILPFIILTARGILRLKKLAAGNAGREEEPVPGSAAVQLGTVILCVSAVVTVVPWRAVDKYHEYRGMRPDIRDLVASGDLDHALVLIRGESHPDLASAFVYGGLDPYGQDPVFALDGGPEIRRRLIESYPQRPVWILDGPSQTGGGYRVVARPNKGDFQKNAP